MAPRPSPDAVPLKRHERYPVRIPAAGPQPVVMLFKLLRARKKTVPDLAAISGVSDRTIRGWRLGQPAVIHNLEAALNSLGYELRAVPRTDRRIADPG